MRNIKQTFDSSHFPKRNEFFLFAFTFVVCTLIDFSTFPSEDHITQTESFKMQTKEKRMAAMYSLKPISFSQRFLLINLIIKPSSSSFSPINITTTSHLRTANSIYNFQLNYFLNTNKSQTITIFKKHSLINSMLSMNLIFEGNLKELSHYSIEITYGKEIYARILVTVRLSFFIISIIALLLYSNIVKQHKSHARFHHIRLILIILIICNFPYLVLLDYKSNYFIIFVDQLTFSFYPAFFISYLFYFCFFIDKTIKIIYSSILCLLLFVLNYRIKEFILTQTFAFPNLNSSFSIWIQVIVLIFHLITLISLKFIKKFESAPAIFGFSIVVVICQILFYVLNENIGFVKNSFIFDILLLQFYNLLTFELVTMFIPNTSNLVNEQMYYVNNYFAEDSGSKSV